MQPPPVVGIVLAGGLGRRMGGVDKAALRLGGETLLARALRRFGPQCAACVVNANGAPERFGRLGYPVVPDSVAGFAGPLAGVLAGLDWAAEHRPDALFAVSIAVDTPFLPHDLVGRLLDVSARAGLPLACGRSGGQAHPVEALWSVHLREDLRATLLAGERKIDRWTARHGLAVADWSTEPLDPFFNINDPAGLAEAEGLLARFGER